MVHAVDSNNKDSDFDSFSIVCCEYTTQDFKKTQLL